MNELHKAYAVLGLDAGSSMESIMRRYKRLIMVWHPDRAPTPEHKEFAEEELKKINNAKDILIKHFGSGGGHKATGCDCQAGAGTKSSAGGGPSPGPGPAYHRTKTAEEKHQEEQAAKKRDAERKAREQAEANAKAQEQYKQQAPQQTMESAMQQQRALQDEKLRWQVSIGIVIAFVALEVFGSMAVSTKKWWHDFTWKWQQEHSDTSQKPKVGTGSDTTTTPTPYVPPYYQTPGGTPTTWQQEQVQRDKEQKEREQKQHDQDVYFTKLEIDKYEKIIEHCNSELTNLDLKLLDPSVSEYEKNRLRETRDFRKKNLEEAQANLKVSRDKLATLTGETPVQSTPSALSPFSTNRPGIPLVPIPGNNSSPFGPPADPNSSLMPSTSGSLFNKKYGLDSLSTPSSSTSSFSDLMKKAPLTSPSTNTLTPSTGGSFFDKKYGLDSLSAPSSSPSSISELMKKYRSGQQTTPPSTTNP
jgi:curved DNA-binding protein CbpA